MSATKEFLALRLAEPLPPPAKVVRDPDAVAAATAEVREEIGAPPASPSIPPSVERRIAELAAQGMGAIEISDALLDEGINIPSKRIGAVIVAARSAGGVPPVRDAALKAASWPVPRKRRDKIGDTSQITKEIGDFIHRMWTSGHTATAISDLIAAHYEVAVSNVAITKWRRLDLAEEAERRAEVLARDAAQPTVNDIERLSLLIDEGQKQLLKVAANPKKWTVLAEQIRKLIETRAKLLAVAKGDESEEEDVEDDAAVLLEKLDALERTTPKTDPAPAPTEPADEK